jgi:hypothetical protein
MAEMLYLTQDSDHYQEPIRICLIAGHEWKVPKGKRDERCYLTESSVADARLIAAAPELLQALREISNVLNLALPKFELNDESSDDEDSYDDVVSVLTRAEAAIAKAISS